MDLLEILDVRKEKAKSGKVYPRRFGLFQCYYCGRQTEMRIDNGKKIDSCGCNQAKAIGEANQTHGDTLNYQKEKLYSVWQNMNRRCRDPKSNNYKWYGGRGIKVCRTWKNDYKKFKDWALKNGYRCGLTIDRINNDGNYSWLNCRWVSMRENLKNKRIGRRCRDGKWKQVVC